MEQFRVEPEFQNKIPPISEDEYKQLRENILAAGEVYEPLVVWDGVLVDGHNRWKIIQENPTIKYKVRRMDFPDKWAAFDWMYKNQLGRRNLTFELRKYCIGKMYEARKKSQGEHNGNQYTKLEKDQNDLIPNDKPKSTAEAIAQDVGVSEPSVKRWEKFAKGVDALREVIPEAADKVLSGKANVSQPVIQEIAKADKEQIESVAEAIVNNKLDAAPKKKVSRDSAKTSEDKKELQEIEAIVSRMYDPTATPEFTIDFLIEDIEVNGQVYVELLDNTLKDRSNLVTESNKPRIVAAIQNIEDKIKKVMESI